jgi:tetratricopeptide (TPR) repeat protein
VKIFNLVVLCLASALPVLAADEFSQGCALYNSGSYNRALPILQAAVRKKPNYWAGHYYLAHTYLSLGQRSLAIREYENCQACNPSADIAAACQRVVYQLSSQPGARSQVSGAGTAAYGSATPKPSGPHAQELQADKQFIIDQANQEVARLRVEEDKAINDFNNSTNVRYANRDGSVPVLAPGARTIRDDYEDKIRDILERAHKKADSVR